MRKLRTIKSSKIVVNDEKEEKVLDPNEPFIRTKDSGELTFNQIVTMFELGKLASRSESIMEARSTILRIAELQSKAEFEGLYAEQCGWVAEKSFWDKIAEVLEGLYKKLNTACMSHGTEARYIGL